MVDDSAGVWDGCLTMTPKPLERDIEKAIRKYAEQRKCLFEKFVSPAKRGVADRVIIAPGGAVGWLEVKRPGAEPTVLQYERMAEKRKLGCNVSWCDNVADGCKFVDSLIAEGARRNWEMSQQVARIHGK